MVLGKNISEPVKKTDRQACCSGISVNSCNSHKSTVQLPRICVYLRPSAVQIKKAKICKPTHFLRVSKCASIPTYSTGASCRTPRRVFALCFFMLSQDVDYQWQSCPVAPNRKNTLPARPPKPRRAPRSPSTNPIDANFRSF